MLGFTRLILGGKGGKGESHPRLALTLSQLRKEEEGGGAVATGPFFFSLKKKKKKKRGRKVLI